MRKAALGNRRNQRSNDVVLAYDFIKRIASVFAIERLICQCTTPVTRYQVYRLGGYISILTISTMSALGDMQPDVGRQLGAC